MPKMEHLKCKNCGKNAYEVKFNADDQSYIELHCSCGFFYLLIMDDEDNGKIAIMELVT